MRIAGGLVACSGAAASADVAIDSAARSEAAPTSRRGVTIASLRG